MSRLQLSGVDVAVAGVSEPSSTTIGAIGAQVVVVATALPERGVTLSSCYLAAMVGDIAVSHQCSAPDGLPVIGQRVLPGDQPGQTHARFCVLDHTAELQARVSDLLDATVTIDVPATALQRAADIWNASNRG